MRISDWSSDVCSSDLQQVLIRIGHHRRLPGRVHVEEFVAALPRRFAHEFVPHALFAEQEPDLARKGAKRELIELPHAPGVTAPADEAEGLAIRRRSIARSRRAAPGGVPAFPWAPPARNGHRKSTRL